MSKHRIAASQCKPTRLCKMITLRSPESVLESNTGGVEGGQNQGESEPLRHTHSQTSLQQATNRQPFENPTGLSPQSSGSIIHVFDPYAPTRLFHAIHWGNMRDIREWYKSDPVDVAPTDAAGRTVLHLGAKQGELGLFRLLLQQSGVKIDAVDASGKTALSYAAQYERAALVQRLLRSYGASVDTRDNFGRTPLSYAAEHNSYRSLELLLEAGADVALEDASGKTPLFHAVEAGNCAATVRLVRHTGDGNHALAFAGQMEMAKIEKRLLEIGKDSANWEDGRLRRLLLQSAHRGRDEMVRMLLHLHKVDVDTRDGDGRTPLSLAAEKGHCNIIRILSRCGADRCLKDKESRSPVDYASWHGASTHRCILKGRVKRAHESRCLTRVKKSSGS